MTAVTYKGMLKPLLNTPIIAKACPITIASGIILIPKNVVVLEY